MTQKAPTTQAPGKEVPEQLASKAESTTTKKPEPDKSVPKLEEAKVESVQPAKIQPEKTTPETPKPMTLADIQMVVEALSKTVIEHSEQISELKELLAQKRKPTQNGKIQIKDKQTGKVYPSKNNTYQSMLKAGQLKGLVDQGVFGDNPAKNNFGWFALNRAYPDRFEELKTEEKTEEGK